MSHLSSSIGTTVQRNPNALDRLRQLVNLPLENRPPQFENPLEKIEQLLTCSICLDRFKNPKLLPCQHTYCMEPCLDSLVDLVKNTVKCPECRAEHAVPLDGVRQFQTNYSLMGFLEIHIQATEENAAELESYIRKYNLQRCRVCDEKTEVDLCQHCDKKICSECKSTHIDTLKRDLSRLMNQVKRIAGRLSESNENLHKNTESFVQNCEAVKEEVKDHVSRFIKELKKRENTLLAEIEAFQRIEVRLSKNTNENLESELVNVAEACQKVEASLKLNDGIFPDENGTTNESDLVRFKQLFIEGVEYLKTMNIDTDDICNKKVRFVPDPHLLPHAISQFGDLQICAPQFNQKFISYDHFYVPKFANPGSESEAFTHSSNKRLPSGHYTPEDLRYVDSRRDQPKRYSNPHLQHRQMDNNEQETRHRNQNRSPVRQKMVEESAWRRLREGLISQPETDSTSSSNPWVEVQRMVENSPAPSSTSTAENPPNSSPVTYQGVVQSEPDPVLGRKMSASTSQIPTPNAAQNHGNSKKPPIVVDHKASIQIKLAPRSVLINKSRETSVQPNAHPENSSSEEEEEEEEEEDEDENIEHTCIDALHAPENQGQDTPVAVQRFQKTVLSEKPEARSETTQVDRKRPPAIKPKPSHLISPKGRSSFNSVASSAASHSELSSTSPPPNTKAVESPKCESREGSNDSTGAGVANNADMSWNDRRRRFFRSKTNPELSSESLECPTPKGKISSLTVNTAGSKIASKIGSDRRTSQESSANSHIFGHQKFGREIERRNRYKRKADKNHSLFGHSLHSVTDDESFVNALNRSDSGSINNGSPSNGSGTNIAAAAPGAKFYRHLTYTSKIDYVDKGRLHQKFGCKGSSTGQFNWPRGVWLMPATGEVAVCDSSNHRLQIFDRRGNFLKSMGSYEAEIRKFLETDFLGSSKGEFDCLAGVCVNKYHQFLISDRYNHRIQIFDSNGRHLREFGSHGQSNGRFNSPWGLAVDNQGFIYVCDKDNHRIYTGEGSLVDVQRSLFLAPPNGSYYITTYPKSREISAFPGRVQIFQTDGNFVGKFGSLGNREGQFQNPHFITVNKYNHIIVSDTNNHRIQVFDHEFHFLFMFGSEGFHPGQFKYPRGVAVDDQGLIFVADSGNNRVQIFWPDGRFYTCFGSWGSSEGQMKGVEGIAVTEEGNIVVADRDNHRIQIF